MADCDPAAFTIDTMRDRVRDVGDLTAGMWERAVSLVPLFERVGLKPPGDLPTPRKRSGPPRDWRKEYAAKKAAERAAADAEPGPAAEDPGADRSVG